MSPSKWLKFLDIRPLTGRLIWYVLAYSLTLSVLVAAIQIYNEYEEDGSRLIEEQRKLAGMLGPTLANGLWYINTREVESTLRSMLELPAVQRVRIITSEGREFSFGVQPVELLVEQRFPLSVSRVHQPQHELVGELIISSALVPLGERLRKRGMIIFLAQALMLLLGALGLMVIVRQTLTRHLETMALYATRLNFDRLIAPLRLKRHAPRRPDELSELEKALNAMRIRLLEEARHLRKSELNSQNERDEAIRANRAKSLFLANVSHELRTPLQSVLGYALMLEDTRLDSEQREYLRTLRVAGENLATIINDLLDISRIEAGKLSLENMAFDLRETLNDVMFMLGPRAREKGLTLEMRIDDHLPNTLIGDPVRLRQILLNLTSNAIRFTDSGHVLIGVEILGRQHEDQLTLRLSVEDTGIGIAREDLPLIYEPYVQLTPRFRRAITGAGLGLTICRQLVSLMNGSLDVDSRQGEGSTFWVELELKIAADTHRHVREDLSALQGKHVLVADSYALSRQITLELLARMNVKVEAARTAAEAILTIRQSSDAQQPFDIVILDGFLPDMESDLLCQQIREQADWKNTRLLILSSNPQRGDAEHFRQAGSDGFLSKALRESSLGPLLQQLMIDREHGLRLFVTRFSLQPNSQTEQIPALPSQRIRALLVEDNPVNRTLTRRLLEKLGCEVTTAEDGERASQLWPLRPFDIIFMDCQMPRMDGFEATRQLRTWEAQQGRGHIPVVALTASAMEKDEERSRKAGMDFFLAKPINMETLRAVVEQVSHRASDV